MLRLLLGGEDHLEVGFGGGREGDLLRTAETEVFQTEDDEVECLIGVVLHEVRLARETLLSTEYEVD